MLIITTALITLTAVLIAKVRSPEPARLASLGVMSEQWLAEHRASRTA